MFLGGVVCSGEGILGVPWWSSSNAKSLSLFSVMEDLIQFIKCNTAE